METQTGNEKWILDLGNERQETLQRRSTDGVDVCDEKAQGVGYCNIGVEMGRTWFDIWDGTVPKAVKRTSLLELGG